MRVIERLLVVTTVIVALGVSPALSAGPHAQYIANAGVMITSGDTKVVFDPLFSEDFDLYELVPPEMQRRLLAGEPPFDGIDAAFISHSHDDHFDARLMLDFLERNEQVLLFAPESALSAIEATDPEAAGAMRDRLNVVVTGYGAPPFRLRVDDLQITAVHVPHAGWPDRHANVENIAFSVALDDTATIVHLGDADTRVEHFEKNAKFWGAQHHQLALPPFWFFLSPQGNSVLSDFVRADATIGVHVPVEMADDPARRPPEYAGFDLFTRPGETRDIAIAADESPYAGEESRAIKSLSPEDIESLRRGEGMGYAKVAELNNYPGPRHVLDLADRLDLTESQLAQTRQLYDDMRASAIAVGEKLIAAESALSESFAEQAISAAELETMLEEIGLIESELRNTHLQAHLKQRELLTAEQVRNYDKLRGYGGHGSHDHGAEHSSKAHQH